jgi:hypothetical protein
MCPSSVSYVLRGDEGSSILADASAVAALNPSRMLGTSEIERMGEGGRVWRRAWVEREFESESELALRAGIAIEIDGGIEYVIEILHLCVSKESDSLIESGWDRVEFVVQRAVFMLVCSSEDVDAAAGLRSMYQGLCGW